jgi:hypothetical protein
VASDDPIIGIGVHRVGAPGGQTIYTISTELLGVRTGRFHPGRRVEVRIPFTANLMNGDYAVTVAVAKCRDEAGNSHFHDWVSNFVTFSVVGSQCAAGLVDLGGDFESDDVASTSFGGVS